MNAWLYRELNAEAKAWPYYRHDRALQRRSIREALRTVRDALATKDAYVGVGKGDTSLHYQRQPDGPNLRYGTCTHSGFGGRMVRVYQRLGLPVIDMRDADWDKLAAVVIRGPMVAVGTQAVDEGHALEYRPLREIAAAYAAAGCAVYNMGETI